MTIKRTPEEWRGVQQDLKRYIDSRGHRHAFLGLELAFSNALVGCIADFKATRVELGDRLKRMATHILVRDGELDESRKEILAAREEIKRINLLLIEASREVRKTSW